MSFHPDSDIGIKAAALQREAVVHLGFRLTEGQQTALGKLARFTFSRPPRGVFVLNGFAGTGKTSLMGAYVRALGNLGLNTVLLAPTGRAAKVFTSFAGKEASTIHRRLYRPSGDPGSARYTLAPNRQADTLFIVDEASLIGDAPDLRHSLLQQLIRHVYSAPGCALVLMGDTAQLPPVGQRQSMAMNVERLRSLGLDPDWFTLHQPVRQAALSGILANATMVRKFITGERHPDKLCLNARDYSADVTVVSGDELEDRYTSSLSIAGHEGTIVLTRSNWRANMINRDIRFRILDAEGEIGSGERLLITRNNYYWARRERHPLLANGDMATVSWIGTAEEKYGYRFADAELLFQGRPDPVAAKLMLSTLDVDTPNIPQAKMVEFYCMLADSMDSAGSPGRLRLPDNNPYFNALQIKHAYCVTTHKAQGGQWRHVYIDMAGIHPDDFGQEFYRWLYTAMTRSTEHIYLINPTLPVIL